MIGRHYSKHSYNCAHFVSDWYREKLGITVPVINEFDRSFVVWMRKHFSEIPKPKDHALVLMTNSDGGYHVGIYCENGVFHNFSDGVTSGAVCKWTLGTVINYYENRVRYYEWSG